MPSGDTHSLAQVKSIAVIFDFSCLYLFHIESVIEFYFLHLQKISGNLSSPSNSTATIQIQAVCFTHPTYHNGLPTTFSVSTFIIYRIFSPKQSKGSFKNAIPFPCLKASNYLDFKFLSMAAHALHEWALSPLSTTQLIPLHMFTLR